MMKKIYFPTLVLTIVTLLLSACGAEAAAPKSAPEVTVSAKAVAMPVSFVGIVNSMNGDQWVISGTTVTVDPAIVQDGPFNVGDRVKVEGFTSSDGTLTLSRVEASTTQEMADENSNDANTNDDHGGSVNSNDDNSNADNTNDDHGGSSVNSNDDNSNTVSSNDNGSVSDDNSNAANSNDDQGGSNTNSNSNDDKSGSGGGNDNGNGGNDDNGNGG